MTRFVVHDETAITSAGRTEQKEKKASAVFSTYSESVMTGGLPKAKRGTSAFKTRRTTDQGRYIITIISVSLK